MMTKKMQKMFRISMLAVSIIFMCMVANDANAVEQTSNTNYKIMQGVTEQTMYVNDNGENVRLHILDINKNANISFKVNTKKYYSKGSTKSSRKNKAKKWKQYSDWGYSKASTQAANYDSSKDKVGTVIAGINGDFFYTGKKNGMTYGNLIMEGNKVHSSNSEPFFAAMNDGSYTIKQGGASTAGVIEAISGMSLLIDGNIVNNDNSVREPRQGIGILSDGSVVIICADGRLPDSKGLTLKSFANVFKQLGCSQAINLDGGGSASFLTKRSGNKKLVFRNSTCDGFIRNVSSTLLIVKNKNSNGKSATNSGGVTLKDSKTELTRTSLGVYKYKISGKYATGFKMINGKSYLFDKKGNGLTKTIKIGKHKYTFKKGKLTKTSDKKSGNVMIGYCGAAKGGTNLLFAYHTTDKVLNIGLNPLVKKNGRMKNWKRYEGSLPWYALRNKIKSINIGNGTTNIGSYFCYLIPIKGFEGTAPQKSVLTKVSIPSTVKTIGEYAFYDAGKLKNVVLPSKVKSVKKSAFAMAGKGYIRFKSSKQPSFGKSVFYKSGFKKVYVKNTSKWKSFVKANKFKKLGLKKSVKIQYKK